MNLPSWASLPYNFISHMICGWVCFVVLFFGTVFSEALEPVLKLALIDQAGWPRTHRDPPASAFQVLELKVWPQVPGSVI